MSDQGYLLNVKVPKPEHMAIAKAIGREWLGDDHAAVRALEVGVGTHHGALPRPFLNAIEQLLDARRLSIVVASPTLAQGIDLACSVLIFRSLKRYEDDEWRHISPAEFSNVVGRAGRAYVDLDGIAVLPSFDSQSRPELHRLYKTLIEKSRGQRLLSGLAQLIWRISEELRKKLGVQKDAMLDYVLNQNDLWDDDRLTVAESTDEDEEEVEDGLEKYISDLDVALFSLVEPLETDAEELAALLDEVLKDSLWKRTLAHLAENQRNLEVALLQSRVNWLWRNTTEMQRRACFFSGLGRQPGLFIHEQLDELVDFLCDFQTAVTTYDLDSVTEAAIKLAQLIMPEKFFSVRKLPEKWEDVLAKWVTGIAFSEILDGKKASDAQRTQAFVQDGVIFRLVWAAEAARVQAIAIDHPRHAELGDGPAFALTYGVPTVPAALLCQMGFSSRVGALWVTGQLSASFKNNEGLWEWLREHDAILEDPDFWGTDDHFLLWRNAAAPPAAEYPRSWNHKRYEVPVKWGERAPKRGTLTRFIPGTGRAATVCGADLLPLGTVQLPFNPHGVALDGTVISSGQVAINYFGSA